MSYLPDIYKNFERAFPTVHAAGSGLRSSSSERSGLEEDGQSGREPVQEGLAADRADFAAAEEAGEGLGPE
ncbi:MAG: hypothetical protein H0W31_11415, partial [Actinobacteria bacterium]|nr:hypothetical protein [Actinomycetota bacterium]